MEKSRTVALGRSRSEIRYSAEVLHVIEVQLANFLTFRVSRSNLLELLCWSWLVQLTVCSSWVFFLENSNYQKSEMGQERAVEVRICWLIISDGARLSLG